MFEKPLFWILFLIAIIGTVYGNLPASRKAPVKSFSGFLRSPAFIMIIVLIAIILWAIWLL
jgi:hypothetical protein